MTKYLSECCIFSNKSCIFANTNLTNNNMKEKVEEIWKKYNDFKENAEQHMFVQLVMYDRMLIPAYNDLQKNWSDDHAEKFINGMTKVVFKKLGIK